MPVQRAHSRAYLAVVLGRPARLVEVWRHFFAFARIPDAQAPRRPRRAGALPCWSRKTPRRSRPWCAPDRPALFGTFHFGGSDLLGYLLGERGRRVSILRLRVGNSADTRLLGQRFAGQVSFLWINDPANLLFDLKAAIEAGESLALKCDRLEFSAKTEPFHFLGARRLFPFTIYHLALLFDRPVVFCTAVPGCRARQSCASSPRRCSRPIRRRTARPTLARRGGISRRCSRSWKPWSACIRSSGSTFMPLNPEAPAARPLGFVHHAPACPSRVYHLPAYYCTLLLFARGRAGVVPPQLADRLAAGDGAHRALFPAADPPAPRALPLVVRPDPAGARALSRLRATGRVAARCSSPTIRR